MIKPKLPNFCRVIPIVDRDNALQLSDKDLMYIQNLEDFIFLCTPIKENDLIPILEFQEAYYSIIGEQVFIYDFKNGK